jgi:hypothetical protein
MRIYLNIGLGTLIFGVTVTQSSHLYKSVSKNILMIYPAFSG